MGFYEAYTHNGDAGLLASLGLQVTGFGRDWTDLGTVTLAEATVKVEVSAMPAQFWRFTIDRPKDTADSPAPREQVVVETGSGSFADYWPTAEGVAQNVIQIREVKA